MTRKLLTDISDGGAPMYRLEAEDKFGGISGSWIVLSELDGDGKSTGEVKFVKSLAQVLAMELMKAAS